jgi:Tfp pilus assembly protein PilO
MNRIHAAFAGGLAAMGWPGVVGLGLAVFACGFYFSTLRQEQARLIELNRQTEIAQRQDAAGGNGAAAASTPLDKLGAFYAYFPRQAELPDLLDKVFAAAKGQGLLLEHGEYRVRTGDTGGLTQFQLTLPVHGTYPQIRKFVDGALTDVAALSLEGIQFERQKVGEPMVNAKVKLAVYLGKKS